MTIDSKIQSTRQGRLLDIAKTVDLSTVQHSYEIQNDRRRDIELNKNNADLHNQWFWTADFPLYTMDKGEVVLNMATRENNLLLKNLDTAVEQLRTKNNYFPNKSDIGAVISADTTLKTNLSDLKLQKFDNEWSYFEIKTEDYNKLNQPQRLLAERIHGTGNDFIENMKMLRSKGIKTTNVYVLNPDYVKKTLTNNNAESLARGSVLDNFDGNSYFGAGSRDVDINLRRLRGVPSEARSADAPKIDQYDEALKLITGNPSESLQRMQKNPNYATGLNALIGNYLKSKA